MSSYKLQLETAIAAAVAGGNHLEKSFGQTKVLGRKESNRDIFTKADLDAEQIIIDRIEEQFPGAVIVAEESVKPDVDYSNDSFWVIDALDGTVNFLHSIPMYCVSVAYLEKGKSVVGCIMVPRVGDLYYAAKGIGAFKNHDRIYVREETSIEMGLFAASFSGGGSSSTSLTNRHKQYEVFGYVNDKSRGCLRTGSAALNLAYCAGGNLTGAWGIGNKIWDISAGLLIAEEAGLSVFCENLGRLEHPELASYLVAQGHNFDTLLEHLVERDLVELDG